MQNKFLSSSVARKIFLSYISVLVLIFFTIGILSYYWVSYIVENQEKKTCIASLMRTDELLISNFKELDTFTNVLSQTHWVRKIALTNSNKIDFTRITPYELANYIRELGVYNSLNKFVDRVSIYLNEKDIFITPSGYDDVEWFFSYANRFKDSGQAENWTELMNNMSPLDDAIIRGPLNVNNYWTNNNVLIYLKVLPIVMHKAKATLFITINERQIQEILSNSLINEASCIYLLDINNHVLSSVNANNEFDRIIASNDALQSNTDFKRINSSRSESFFMFSLSPVQNPMGWKYVMFTPVDSVMGKVYLIKYVMIALYSLFFTLGLLLCYRSAFNNYKPINNIAQLLKNIVGQSDNVNPLIPQNEYDFIEMGIRNICFRESAIKEKMEKYFYDAAINDLLLLMKGEKEFEPGDEKLSRITTLFNKPLFSIAIFLLSNNQNYFSGLIEDTSWLAYSSKQDNTVIFIINVDSPVHIDEAITQLETACGRNITAGISSVGDISDLNRCYKEACLSLEYKQLKNETGIMRFEELPLDYNMTYSLPIYDSGRLAEQIHGMDISGIRTALNDALRYFLAQNNLSLSIERYLFYKQASVSVDKLTDYQLKEIVLGHIDELKNQPGQALAEYLFKEICKTGKYSNIEQTQDKQLIERVISYINEHYMEQQMSLNLLSSVFGVSPSKICCLFKEHIGEGYHDYISKLRIQTAKVLLAKGQLSIEDISYQIGYNNVTTFRRIFKKYEGLPPGEYKESLMLKDKRQAAPIY